MGRGRGDTHVILVLALLILQKQLQALFPNLRLNMSATAVPRLALAVVLPFLLHITFSSARTKGRGREDGRGTLGSSGSQTVLALQWFQTTVIRALASFRTR